ncbi:gliding motility-associated lipoprotein GldK/gliding motility-associated lipoprotein GldK,TIGR03529 [Mucilaginibacter mallensis]|uniref:Gliding motility-associated lipoprotein GldK/gliding motility-associated lipoprotein GldK,TIGR03529 n=1 Tax=Mucilaginibacter mallensis TaxID=652787 RepID=A0A1H1RK90_MUCMA|nr:SUMF1/EgtB/PvdO family nonheme iron enzyme [Mucilaginibacter mallensis]SDS36118.1 gliding motility-associated lipoprotein GldK/gliding motility-associated lipoprotein GldK,TIGR03529 [Mucilaginibacter mallensis]
MKQIYSLVFILVTLAALSSCRSGGGGELTGVPQRNFRAEVPYGMVYIPGGTFLMGQTDQDITYSQISQTKQVTVPPFFMDQTEISNSQYKQFVFWVRDSIAITNYLNDDKYYLHPKGATAGKSSGKKYINWEYVKRYPVWSPARKGQGNNGAKLDGMYYQGDDRVFDRNEIDVRLLKYNYSMLVLRNAANYKNDKSKRRSDFILRDTVQVYPDTLVWLSDFSYAANEPMVQGYFSHPAYRNYPVVGVTWRQARAFTVWRTRYNDSYKDSHHLPHRLPYELPSEAQFEYAARGGRIGTDYPWGGPYIKNAKGCLLANFKPGRGNYSDDGGAYTVNVRSYFPNDYGLYNMAGNVAEWTSSTFNPSASTFVSDMAPTYEYEAKASDPEELKRKVVKGGSWKDVGYFLQNSSRSYEYQDTAKSYIGFRCVTSFMGRDIRDKH